jgi:hypothetical protein
LKEKVKRKFKKGKNEKFIDEKIWKKGGLRNSKMKGFESAAHELRHFMLRKL